MKINFLFILIVIDLSNEVFVYCFFVFNINVIIRNYICDFFDIKLKEILGLCDFMKMFVNEYMVCFREFCVVIMFS